MNKTRWVAYGVTGVVGLGALAGGAAAAASTMELRTTGGTIVPGGAITDGHGDVIDRGAVSLRVTDSSVTVISAPSPTAVGSATDTTASPDDVPTGDSAPSAPVASSPDSPASPASAPSSSAGSSWSD